MIKIKKIEIVFWFINVLTKVLKSKLFFGKLDKTIEHWFLHNLERS